MAHAAHPHDFTKEQRRTVIILGGKGGLEAHYREAAASYGYDLVHYETRLPRKGAPSTGKIALVIVMVTMISHPLMAQARDLAREGAAIVYLKSPSVSAVRETVSRARVPVATVTPAFPHRPEARRARAA